MPSKKELLTELRHDVIGTCSQLQAALPLLEKFLTEDDTEAMELLNEMALSAKKLSEKILAKTVQLSSK